MLPDAISPPPTAPMGAMASAVVFLRRGVRPDGTPEDGSDWEIASHQWGLFISWAYHRGVALPATVAPEREGGREHDLRFDAPSGRWLKFTKPFSAGFAVDWTGEKFVRRPATPLEYLRRWRLANRLFGGGARLVGLSCLGRTQRIVVSQSHWEGETPTWDEIDAAMKHGHGLRRIPAEITPANPLERHAYGRGRLAVFDVCPANCVRTADGSIRFFDVIPQMFNRTETAHFDH